MFEGKKKKSFSHRMEDARTYFSDLERVCVCRQEVEEQGRAQKKTGPGMAKMCRRARLAF